MDFFSRFYVVRHIVRSFRTQGTRSASGPSSKSLFPDLSVASIVSKLVSDGVSTDIRLPSNVLDNILEVSRTQPCDGNGQSAWSFRYREKTVAEANYNKKFSSAVYKGVLQRFPAVQALANDPTLLEIARNYIGSEAKFMDCRLWWTFAAAADHFDTELTASFFHYDKDDYGCLRLFFYLTDVDQNAGPHHVILTSHRKKTLSQIFSLGERKQDELVAHFGSENHLIICGPKGQGFLEDPFCFHRASRPISQDRLVLQLRYASRDYGVFNDS